MKTMKFLILIVFFILLPKSVFATFATDSVPNVDHKHINLTGNWSDVGPRSLPIHPEAFVEENEVTVCFTEPLTNITILVTDPNGVTLYQETISPPNNTDYKIPYWFDEGEYLLTLSHFRGKLSGEFVIDE